LIRIGNEWQVVQGALAGLERIFEVLTLSTDEKEGGIEEAATAGGDVNAVKRNGKSEKRVSPGIDGVMVEVDRVTFGYLDERPVLTDLSLQVQSGQHLAIVGRTGAGKSSLIHLLGGIYLPWKGTIRIDGYDPNNLSSDQRRRILGVVPQVGWMFGGSIADNLTFGDKTIPRTAVEKAARISGAESFVTVLPAGYDTTISDVGRGKGAQFSAGQTQLLALARALVGDPAVLLLDEATAAVDSATEAAFKRALRTQIEERQGAVITIAHRLSTAMEADYIAVMEGGRIVEYGRPSDLLRSGGNFASLCELENAGWQWREQAPPRAFGHDQMEYQGEL
jgi:ATP-binding cassette subfamily B protein